MHIWVAIRLVKMKKYIVLDKLVGETPLSCVESWRAAHPQYVDVPLAYAGRLDPMASGKLLVLIGDECKKQTTYHGLDKKYEFSVLFGIASDTQDVLGRLQTVATLPELSINKLQETAKKLTGNVTLPYPHFSSKTVQGKPLHTWTLENRLNEIKIPTVASTIYTLECDSLTDIAKQKMVTTALEKIETIPPVTDLRKALGNDFRRVDVRKDWHAIKDNQNLPNTYQIATFSCIATSGTYMRSLAALIAKEQGTIGLAWHINRTDIGTYDPITDAWSNRFI